MKNYILIAVFTFFCFNAYDNKAQDIENYKLDSADVISIIVFDEPDLSIKEGMQVIDDFFFSTLHVQIYSLSSLVTCFKG